MDNTLFDLEAHTCGRVGYADWEIDTAEPELAQASAPTDLSVQDSPGQVDDFQRWLELGVSESSPVNTYTPRGKARGDLKYFRYSYRDGGRTRHRHIPGGNTTNSLAQVRAEYITDLASAGTSCTEILRIIASWG